MGEKRGFVAAPHRRHTFGAWRALALCYVASLSMPAYSSDASGDDLADLSLEQLSSIEVTSVSRHAESLQDAAASIYVISSQDIRRSGVTTLPEALRLAPNLQVAQTGSAGYAISARGFNNAIGNKLLVLIDGRTVYTPLYSGVNWDAQNVLLEDVERIEVISGPGAVLWGANAVNGVINVITRSARHTQGALLSAGASELSLNGAARYGGRIGDNGYFRVYGMGFDRQNTELSNGTPVPDGWKLSQGGFRADWGQAGNSFTLQGDAYSGKQDDRPIGAAKVSGANLLARWTRELSADSSFQLQAYYDHAERDDPASFRDEVDLFDVEFQHSLVLAKRHHIVWGGGYRYAIDKTKPAFNPTVPALGLAFEPQNRNLHWGNLFVQDEIALTNAINLTVGLKAETNVYTGVEYLPSMRIAWKPDASQLVWGALSRAVRAPSRIDTDFRLYLTIPPGVPIFTFIKGGPHFQSEVANVIEIGYRAQPSSSVSYSLTGFYSVYDKLRSGQLPPAFIQNMMEGTTSGIEAWGSYQATRAWRLSGGMTLFRDRFKLKPGSLDPTGPSALGNDPAHTWMLRSSLDLSADTEFDMTIRHVGTLPDPEVPAYTALDARLGWRPQPGLELSVTVQNMFDPGHPEFGAAATRSDIGRGVYFKILWHQ